MISKREFNDWLHSFKPDAIIGFRDHITRNPLSTYLFERDKIPYITMNRYFTTPTRLEEMPHWAVRFNDTLMLHPHQVVTASECINLLEDN